MLERLPVFPLPSTVLFPDTDLPLHVFEPRYREMVRYCLDRHRIMGVALLKPGYEADYEGRPPIYEIFGAGEIVEADELDDGRFNIVVRGLERVRALRELPSVRGFRLFRTAPVAAPSASPDRMSERTLRSLAMRLANAVPDVKDPISRLLGEVRGSDLADQLACRLIPDAEKRQRILEEPDPERRYDLVTSEVAEVCLRLDPACRTGLVN